MNTVKFFLGASSEKGFVSYFKQLQNQTDSMQLLILKGGPGSGKSSLMKKTAAYAESLGHTVEFCPCASDPESLDAVIDKTANFAIMDGTAPHTEDPLLPGALHHIIYTGALWDSGKLRFQKDEIEFFSDLTGEYHNSAGAYIKAATALLGENFRISRKYINESALYGFVKKTLKNLPQGEKFTEKTRLLSAVTVGEIKFFEETIPLFADKIYVIEDEWGGASHTIFEAVRNLCKMNGIGIIHCPCSVMPEKTDHILIPGMKTAFTTGNRFFGCSCGEKIKGETFYTTGIDKSVMEKRSIDAEKLLSRATVLVKTAKKTHDRLEKFYINAIDFEKSDLLFEEIKHKFY